MLLGIAAVLIIVVLMSVIGHRGPGSGDTPVGETKAARAAVLAKQAEANRMAERARVEQGIPGRWSGSTGSSERPTILTIKKVGGEFMAEYTSVIGPEVLRGQLQPDNQLRLFNQRQSGKLVPPGAFYDGDFSQESRMQLSLDGSLLTVWPRGANSYIIAMTRIAGTAPERASMVDVSQIEETSDAAAVQEGDRERRRIIHVDRAAPPTYPDWPHKIMYPELQDTGPADFDVGKLDPWWPERPVKGDIFYDRLRAAGTLGSFLNVQDLSAIQARGLDFFREHWKNKLLVAWKSVIQSNPPDPARSIFAAPTLAPSFVVPLLYETSGKQLVLRWVDINYYTIDEDDLSLHFLR